MPHGSGKKRSQASLGIWIWELRAGLEKANKKQRQESFERSVSRSRECGKQDAEGEQSGEQVAQGAAEAGHGQLQRCRCGAEERGCGRNPHLSCTLPPRGLYKPLAAPPCWDCTRCCHSALPQISVLGEGQAEGDKGYRRKIGARFPSAPIACSSLNREILLQSCCSCISPVSGLSQSRVLGFLRLFCQ